LAYFQITGCDLTTIDEASLSGVVVSDSSWNNFYADWIPGMNSGVIIARSYEPNTGATSRSITVKPQYGGTTASGNGFTFVQNTLRDCDEAFTILPSHTHNSGGYTLTNSIAGDAGSFELANTCAEFDDIYVSDNSVTVQQDGYYINVYFDPQAEERNVLVNFTVKGNSAPCDDINFTIDGVCNEYQYQNLNINQNSYNFDATGGTSSNFIVSGKYKCKNPSETQWHDITNFYCHWYHEGENENFVEVSGFDTNVTFTAEANDSVNGRGCSWRCEVYGLDNKKITEYLIDFTQDGAS
jgi:hypothetical protein